MSQVFESNEWEDEELMFEGSDVNCLNWIRERNKELWEASEDETVLDESLKGSGSAYFNDLEYFWEIV